jgi:hypothetical protein
VLVTADHEMLEELQITSAARRMRILKEIQSQSDSFMAPDTESLLQIVAKNDKTIDDLQYQIEHVKNELHAYRSAPLAVRTNEPTRKIPTRTLSSPENADKTIRIIPLGQEEKRVQITEKDLCKAIIADTLAKLKITADWKDYIMLLLLSKKSMCY